MFVELTLLGSDEKTFVNMDRVSHIIPRSRKDIGLSSDAIVRGLPTPVLNYTQVIFTNDRTFVNVNETPEEILRRLKQ